MISIEDTSSARLQATPAGVQQFRTIRFGLSVHWGLYALPGRGEWVMHTERIPIPEYEKLARQFNPVRFDAEAWAALIAESGARALLITTKHHDGFCMYDTALTNYKITNTSWGRDPMAELADACHLHTIQLYFYYSLLDWHHPDYRTNWPAYVRYYQGQVREICTKYGELGGVIFDGYWPRYEFKPEDAHFRAGGRWDLAGTYDLIHSLQPQAMVANNHHVLPLKGEDWQVWELDMPGENTIGFNTTEIGPLPRATWFNLNRGWSYYGGEQQVKAPDQVIKQLSESAKRDATYWLNVGPTPAGEILPEEAAVLRQVQAWLQEH
jgi:alpha-L-fucosidase